MPTVARVVFLPDSSSGTWAEFEHKRQKLETMIAAHLEAHRQTDQAEAAPELAEREASKLKTLKARSEKLTRWVATHRDKIGARGWPIKSNITDNESAKMKTSHGVIQGCPQYRQALSLWVGFCVAR